MAAALTCGTVAIASAAPAITKYPCYGDGLGVTSAAAEQAARSDLFASYERVYLPIFLVSDTEESNGTWVAEVGSELQRHVEVSRAQLACIRLIQAGEPIEPGARTSGCASPSATVAAIADGVSGLYVVAAALHAGGAGNVDRISVPGTCIPQSSYAAETPAL
jgi:hypothetical protein